MKIFNTFVIFVPVIAIVTTHRMHPLSDEFIDFINSNQSLWRAGRNFHRSTSLKYLRRLAGTIKADSLGDNSKSCLPLDTCPPPEHKYNDTCLPHHFDAREKWKFCPTLRMIRDQGGCGSCWAVATASAISDRLCIQSNEIMYLSESDIMSCCMCCGGVCAGGMIEQAFIYLKKYGTVSGGTYNGNGCKPYEFQPCDHSMYHHGHRRPCTSEHVKSRCTNRCQNGKAYYSEKRRIDECYKLTNVREIMAEIYENGPVTTSYAQFEDFYNYKSGIYKLVGGHFVGHHAVKLIGWGEDRGVTYWLAVNSWNTDWGDNGFFKIVRGINHLGIEDGVFAGLFKRKSKKHKSLHRCY